MSATTAAVNPVQPAPPPARSAAGAAPAADEGRFDHHLDAARQHQQHGQTQDKPAHEDEAHEPQAKDAATAETRQRRPADAPAKDEGDPDAAALAAAMLTLIGQAAPAKPLARAATTTPTQTRTIAGAASAARAPAALALLANTAAAATAAVPRNDLGPDALAPLLAKPARQKDASPFEGMQLAQLSSAPAPAAAGTPTAVPTHQLGIASSPGTPTFAQELGEHVVWLGQQDVKQARIRLHPEELGTLDVKVSMNHHRVDVSFAVQHPAAVHAVQQTLPQLDALLAHQGLALGQADVGQRQQQGEGARDGEAAGAVGEIEAEPKAMARTPVAGLGMLDTFA